MNSLFSQAFNPENHQEQDYLELLKAYQRAIDVNVISSITSKDGTIVYANEKFCEVCKIPFNELIGKNHRIINSGFHDKAFFAEMWKVIGNGGVWHGDVKNKASDGTYYWVDTVILPIFNKDGEIFRYLSLRYLITDRKKSEAEREKYIIEVQELMQLVSHKVRKPVSNCLGIVEVIEMKKRVGQHAFTEDEFNTLMQYVKESATELDQFTSELTDYIHRLNKRYGKENTQS